MSRELLASQKNNSGILLDPRTKLAVLITIAVFILGGSYEGIMQYYIIVLAAIPLLLLSAARKWKGAVLYILIFGGSLCLEMFGLSRLAGVANYIAVAIVGILLRFTPSVVMGYFVVTTTTVSEFVAAMERLHLPQQITQIDRIQLRLFVPAQKLQQSHSFAEGAVQLHSSGVDIRHCLPGRLICTGAVKMLFQIFTVVPDQRQRAKTDLLDPLLLIRRK